MDNNWELSKENIQPRKEGRDIKALVAGLTPGKEQHVQRRKEMQQFESALRVNDGDDPLEIWYRYILWTEQNFPMGDAIALKHILERCICHFHKNGKYKDDERFVKIFLKYADILIEPSDVFNYMHDQGIGKSHGLFYETWANLLELCANYKKADEVYQIGIARSAQPLTRLQRLHQQFIQRFVAKVKEDVDEDAVNNKDQRESLAALKTTSHGKVSHDRVRAKSAKIKGGISTKTISNQVTGSSFGIFEDGNGAGSSLAAATGEWPNAPVNSKMIKENVQKPAKWTKAKLADTKSTHTSGPMFSIHEDDAPKEMSNQTPKQVVMSERKPLSSRKITKDELHYNPMQNIIKKDDCEFVVKYRKDEVYPGNCEFSLEELRALEPKYMLGTGTVYYPCDMQETCVMSPESNQIDTICDKPQVEMANISEKDDIDNDVCNFLELQQAENAPIKQNSARLKLNFSLLGYKEITDNETVANTVPISSKDRAQGQESCHNVKNDQRTKEIPSIPAVSVFQPMDAADGATSITTGIDLGTQSQLLCNQEKTALRNWDITKIEGIEDRAEGYYGPTESTGVHDILSFPRQPFVGEDESIIGSLKEDEDNQNIPFEDNELGIGNFSTMLAKSKDEEPAKGFLFARPCHDGQIMQERIPGKETSRIPGMQTAFDNNESCNRSSCRSEDFDNTQQYIPIPCDLVKPSFRKPGPGFAVLYDIKRKGVEDQEFSEGEKPQKNVERTRDNGHFSIFEDGDCIQESNDKQTAMISKSDDLVHPEKQKVSNSMGEPMTNLSTSDKNTLFIKEKVPERTQKQLSDRSVTTLQVSTIPMPNAEFSIFSDSFADVQMPSPARKIPSTDTLIEDGCKLGDDSKMMNKDACNEHPFVIPHRPPFSSQMKRAPCKELTPLAERKQARIDSTTGLGPIWVPSPTVHTKKAKQEILAMFNMTLECEKNEFTINTTQEFTNKFEPHTSEQRDFKTSCSQAPTANFEIFEEEEETEVKPEAGKMHLGGEICITSIKTPTRNAHQKSRDFSLTQDTVPPRLSCTVEIGELECTARNETQYQKKKLSPIEELSNENKGSFGASVDKSWMNYNGANSIGHYHASSEGYDVFENDTICQSEQMDLQHAPHVFDESICDKQACGVHQPYEARGDSLKCSFAANSTQPVSDEIEDALSTLTINATSVSNAGSSFEPKPVNPAEEIASMIRAMDFEGYPTMHILNDNDLTQKFAAHSKVALGGDLFIIHKKIATGGFSDVFAGSNLYNREESHVALKVMKSPESCQWEFYIGEEVHRRIDENGYDDSVHDDFIRILTGYVYSNCAIIQYPLYVGGTLLDFVNFYVAKKGHLNETFSLFYGLNVCRIIKTLHDLDIIHGDVKPDNFLLKPIRSDLTNEDVNCLTLTDFGKSIDLTWFSKSTTFIGRSNTDKFECLQMEKNIPWKYQIDYFAIACTLHVVYFGTYMECIEKDGSNRPMKVPSRKEKEFWLPVFERLINVDDCNDTTLLDSVIRDFKKKLAEVKRRKVLEEVLLYHSHVASGQR